MDARENGVLLHCTRTYKNLKYFLNYFYLRAIMC